MVPLVWLAATRHGHPTITKSKVPVAKIVDGVPMYALDKHTRLGREAIRRFASENDEVRETLARYVPAARRNDAAYMAAFYADAAPLATKLVWNGADELEAFGTETDLLSVGRAAGRLCASVGGSPKQPRTLEQGSRPGVRPATIRWGRDAFHFSGGLGGEMSNNLTSDNPYLSTSHKRLRQRRSDECTARSGRELRCRQSRREHPPGLSVRPRTLRELGRLHPGERHTGRLLSRCPRGNAQRRDPGPQTVSDLEGTRGQRRREPGSG